MIKVLTEKDRHLTLEFLSEDPGLNLFQIGDIENFGFDEDFQTVWGSFDETGKLNGVLLRYQENFIPYFKDTDFDVSEFKTIIQNDSKAKIISGEKQMADQFKDCFIQYDDNEMYFCELTDSTLLQRDELKIHIATPHDAQRIVDLLNTIEEFSLSATYTAEKIAHRIKTQSGRIYFIENDAKDIICNVQTTAENSKSAMVVSVATHKDYRQHGYMTACLSKLCSDLLQENKTLCLFYDNPKAGAVYHKLGFKTIGKWKMLIRK